MLRLTILLLTAAFLPASNAVFAQIPPSAPADAVKTNAADLKWHSIALRHTSPSNVLERMNWKMTTLLDPYAKNQVPPPAPTEANLPEGVARLFALTSNNSLLFYATEAGYKTCREVAAALDIAPRQVKTKLFLVAIPLSSSQTIDLSHPKQDLLQLHKANALFFQPSPATANNYTTDTFDNDATASIPFMLPSRASPFFPDSLPMNGNYLTDIPALSITPHINSDTSIIFSLDFRKLAPAPGPMFPNQPMTIVHTVSNSEMTAYDVTPCFPSNSYRKLLFVTLTILSPAAESNTIKTTP